MAWNLDRAVKAKRHFRGVIMDTLSQSYHGSLNHSEELALIQERIWTPLRGAPRWLVSYLSGFLDCARDARYIGAEPVLVFAHVAPDGARYTATRGARPAHFLDSAAIYSAGRGAEMSKWPNGHFWNHSGKPHFSG
jgi:hypothetical protein